MKKFLLIGCAVILGLFLLVIGLVYYSMYPEYWPVKERLRYTLGTCEFPDISKNMHVEFCEVHKGMFSSQHSLLLTGPSHEIKIYIQMINEKLHVVDVNPEDDLASMEKIIFDKTKAKSILKKSVKYEKVPVYTIFVYDEGMNALYIYTSWS